MPKKNEYQVGDRILSVSNLDKVLYPATGTTKADVMKYYLEVAGALIPQVSGRPVTRKRFPDGVDAESFFRKDLEDSAPEWLPFGILAHKESTNRYPLVEEPAVLAWFAQVAALELHTPQWRFGEHGYPANPDRLVLDLDPGPGVGLAECAEVARWCKEILDGMGMESVPVTSGSKGIHLYAALDGASTAEQVAAVAKKLARALEADNPDSVTSVMKKEQRHGKVFIDWSQNNGKKTTVAPYSLRGREHPTVAAPRTWSELEDPDLRQLEYTEVLQRVAEDTDPIAPLGAEKQDRLSTYRSMRDPSKTAEPVPAAAPRDRTGEDPIFVIQEHHASSLHWDVRFERDGGLVSWAVPKGPPLDPDTNRLAVQTEDHPIEYATFSGTIAKGEYGAGEVKIWDSGTIEVEKWREGKEVIAVLHGQTDGGLGGVPRRYAMIHTAGMGAGKDNDQWLMKFMKGQPEGESQAAPTNAVTLADLPEPMLATAGTEADIRLSKKEGEKWAFEMKWDGYRILAGVGGGKVVLSSRNGKDYTDYFPQLQELAELVSGGAVLDGEVVALGEDGRPDFGALQALHSGEVDVEAVEIRYMVFDILALGHPEDGGQSQLRTPYEERRELLRETVPEGEHITVPPAHTGALAEAMEVSRALKLEGVVAKRLGSIYLPGKRGSAWLKMKFQIHQEVVVVGVREGKGSRAGGIGSLLVAVRDEKTGELAYAGRVGTGFSASQLQAMEGKLREKEVEEASISDVPDADRDGVWWVAPELVGEVALAGRTRDGKVRHAVWRGWRDDKDPGEVRWTDELQR
ncbi:ATP-dependent DNA ligase [Corynebacterium sp. Marseille-P3884]|uniref:ATP-dependent DNA ligase n=1 Tax=Corynebacterium sp. Marseille-P3884 TaxID=2495409 RepID=UPI001B33EF7E|nr:ATP-dependent DNA ligase [Corynebacterium sp. Marseille-P3884]MBP3949056.1 ATP-dependent DNA ligase [Corynebacterium sp. Marseille-P3884]